MKRILLAATLASAAACTAKAGGEQVEKAVTERMVAQGLVVQKIVCPKSIEVKVGTTFDCQITFDNNETFTVRSTVTSKEGTNWEYNFEIVEPSYIAAKLEKALHDGLVEQTQVTPKAVVCGKAGVYRVPATREVLCDVTAPDGTMVKARFDFDEKGQAKGWKVLPADGAAPPPGEPAPPAAP